ncbi:hypothetical protein [Clostridium sp.]|uniref:hypothetical protein n=1 Tax=Clostridium sp. TaxID=1506 RepID=UPI002FDE6D2F
MEYKTNEIIELLLKDKNLNKYFKEYVETYKECVALEINVDMDQDFRGIEDKILNYSREINSNNIKQKIIDHSKHLKKDFNLGKNLNIKYEDYTKKNQRSISYAVKGLVYSITDSLYYGAKESERLKNNMGMTKKRKFKHRKKMEYDQEL